MKVRGMTSETTDRSLICQRPFNSVCGKILMKRQFKRADGRHYFKAALISAATVPLLIGGLAKEAQATEPCGDFGECKVLIEINSSDGDIGFHWLTDGDDLKATRIRDPNRRLVYLNKALGPLRNQRLTETFGESAEPLCWEDPEADPEDLENIVTLDDFVERWADGVYTVRGWSDGERLLGETTLTYLLPAAPEMVSFEGDTISWKYGSDLGNCTPEDGDYPDGVRLLEEDEIDAYEIVLEPDVDGPTSNQKFTIRVSGNTGTMSVSVPQEYLESLPDDTPVKIEVGAIGGEDNATFTEEDGFCINDVNGCD